MVAARFVLGWHAKCIITIVRKRISSRYEALPCGMKELQMHNDSQSDEARSGKIGWIVLWLLGIPLPVLLIFFVLRGCT